MTGQAVTNGECHLRHDAYQSELTLLRPKPLHTAQPPYSLIRSHHSPLRVHYRFPRNAARSSYARDLLERHPPRRTSQPQVTGGSTASRLVAQKHLPSTRTPTRTSQSLGCSALALLLTCQRCRGEFRCARGDVSCSTMPIPAARCTQQRVGTTATTAHPITRNRHPSQAWLNDSGVSQ